MYTSLSWWRMYSILFHYLGACYSLWYYNRTLLLDISLYICSLLIENTIETYFQPSTFFQWCNHILWCQLRARYATSRRHYQQKHEKFINVSHGRLEIFFIFILRSFHNKFITYRYIDAWLLLKNNDDICIHDMYNMF